jgi:membrane protease subunit HflK
MTTRPAWWPRFLILNADNKGPQSPWGGGGGNGDDGGKKDDPRNPWAMPPGGQRGRPGPSVLDEFLKRTRGSGGGGGGGFGGGLPGNPPPRSIWVAGAVLLVVAWLIFTSFHAIAPQERGVVSTFGRYSSTLAPGISMTAPAPFQTVTEVDVQNIRTEEFPQNSGENLMLTGDQNIVDLGYAVRWDIRNPQDYLYQIAKPEETVRATAESAMRAVVAGVTLDQAIGNGRNRIEGQVQNLMQQILDDYRSGIRIQGVAISRAAAPNAVDDAFKDVSAAQQDAVANLNNARAYAQQIIARAQGEAGSFDRVYAQYKLAPEVTRRRMYYETMEAVLAKNDKTVVEAPGVVPYLGVQPKQGAVQVVPAQPEGNQ